MKAAYVVTYYDRETDEIGIRGTIARSKAGAEAQYADWERIHVKAYTLPEWRSVSAKAIGAALRADERARVLARLRRREF